LKVESWHSILTALRNELARLGQTHDLIGAIVDEAGMPRGFIS